jgi:hypothetical protein
MTSSTASDVNPDSPSRFSYREEHGLVWGDYTGDTVTIGRFVGTRTGDLIDISFAHALVGGRVVTGSSSSRITTDDDRLTLVEDFTIGDTAHVSVCVEVP